MRLFTFGRDHERKCATAYVRSPAQAELILRVVDAVHDLLENKVSAPALAPLIRAAFENGGTGVWEQAASWLRKLSGEHPDLGSLWLELAQHPSSTVRFRVACSLEDIPAELLPRIAQLLVSDKSKKVANMANERARLQATPGTADSSSS